jgi:hypothetical protein
MDFSSFDIAWKNFQQSSELMHLAVQQWRKEDARDPAILGLIALYDDCGKNPEMVLQQLNIAKKKVMQGNSQFKIKIVRFSAAAAILLLLGWAGWWILGTQDQVTWSYTDEGIPQLMDEKWESLIGRPSIIHFSKVISIAVLSC